MSVKLENILKERGSKMPVNNDSELLKALDEIIEEELAKAEEERDFDLVDEAIQLSLYLQNKDVDAINAYASEIADSFCKNVLDDNRKKTENKRRKSVKLRWLIPIAAAISILVSGSLIAYAFGFDVISLTKEALMNMKEKQRYKEGNVEIVMTSDTQVFETVEDFEEANLFPSVVLPHDFFAEHPIKMITVYDYGDETEATFTFKDKQLYLSVTSGERFSDIQSNTINIGGFDVVVTDYEGIFQGEFQHDKYSYLVNAPSVGTLTEIIKDMKEK